MVSEKVVSLQAWRTNCFITRGTTMRASGTQSIICHFPIVAWCTWKAMWESQTCGTTLVTRLTYIVKRKEPCPTNFAITICVQFETSLTFDAPAWEQEGIESVLSETVSAREDGAFWTRAAACAVAIVEALLLRALNALSFEHCVALDALLASALLGALAVFLALLAVLGVEELVRGALPAMRCQHC